MSGILSCLSLPTATVSQRLPRQAAAPVPWPSRAGCRHGLRCREGARAARGKATDELSVNTAQPEQPAANAAAAAAARRPPEILEEYSNFSPDPVGHKAGFVAIIGRPNAGKSTLMNALLQQPLSIVTPKAQTTRHRILGILSEPSYQAVFLDTPGIIDSRRNTLEEKMMGAVQQAVKDSDCLLAIVDASYQPERQLAMVQPGEDWRGPPMAVLLNKTDLLGDDELAELQAWFKQNCNADVVLPISALEGANLGAVSAWLEAKLPEGPSLYPKDIVSEQPERFFVAEIIRKHVFLLYRQEIPYGVAVEVVNYKERHSGKKDLIEAEIVLEKERQKSIIIGQAGSAIKQLGTAARVELEEFLGRPVYLSLSVKVREDWRQDSQQLERLGY